MDPLSDVLSLLKPRSYGCGGIDTGGDVAISFPKHDGIKCYAVVSGEGWLAVEGVLDAVHLWPVRLSGTEKQHKSAICRGRDRSWLDGR